MYHSLAAFFLHIGSDPLCINHIRQIRVDSDVARLLLREDRQEKISARKRII